MTDPEPDELRRQRLTDRWKNVEEEGSGDADLPPPSAQPSQPPATPRGSVAGKEKLQAYVELELANEARNAWWHTRNKADGAETFSDFIAAAVQEHILSVTARHNNGEPFPERPHRALPGGRPVRK